jgi:hypothetical protein
LTGKWRVSDTPTRKAPVQRHQGSSRFHFRLAGVPRAGRLSCERSSPSQSILRVPVGSGKEVLTRVPEPILL